MDPEPVIEWAGGVSRLAEQLGITRQVVSGWRRDGRIPYLRACQVESMSGGKWRAEHREARRQPNGASKAGGTITIEVGGK